MGLLLGAAAASKTADLDKLGTRLWNVASKIKFQKPVDPELLCAGKESGSHSKTKLIDLVQFGFLPASS